MEQTYRPTVHTQADLQEVWRCLMGPWGFGGRSIWMIRFDVEHRLMPVITEIAECEDLPDPETEAGLSDVLRMLDDREPGTSFAFLLSHPGRGVDDVDRAWAQRLLDAGHRARVRLEMIHVATKSEVVPLSPDELAGRRTA